jgi:hypothetical protein
MYAVSEYLDNQVLTMVAPKTLFCQGVKYPSVKDLADRYKVHQSSVARRLRAGWSPEQAVGLLERQKPEASGVAVTYKGKQYRNLKLLADELGLDAKTFRARLARGYSLEDAAAGQMRPRISANASEIESEGITYRSKESLAKAHNTQWSIVYKRLKRGWTMRQALGVDPEPPRFRDHEGHARDVKWKHTRTSLSGFEPVPDADGYKIYVITNRVNGKQYIGLTIGNLEDRLKQHHAAARKGRKAPLPNAIRKYGEGAFDVELVRCDARSYDELQDQEINEIARRGTIKGGYNSAVGGSLGTSKPISVNGQRFPSHGQAAEHFGVDIGVFNLRLNRLNWSPEEAAGLVERSWSGKRVEVVVRGVTYPSIRQAAVAYSKDVGKVYDRFSEKGWALEQALGIEPPPETTKYTGMEITAFGVTYKSIAQVAKAHGIEAESLRLRLARGIEPELAITLTQSRMHKKQDTN